MSKVWKIGPLHPQFWGGFSFNPGPNSSVLYDSDLFNSSFLLAESGEASDSNEEDYSNVADAKVRAQDRQNKIYSMRYDKKSSALSELKAKRQERERKDQERKEKKELENRDTEGKESSSGEGTDYVAGKRKNFKRERSRSRSSSSSR